MANLVEQLRALARAEHSDLSIAGDAADEIERLRDEKRYLDALIKTHIEGEEALQKTTKEARASIKRGARTSEHRFRLWPLPS